MQFWSAMMIRVPALARKGLLGDAPLGLLLGNRVILSEGTSAGIFWFLSMLRLFVIVFFTMLQISILIHNLLMFDRLSNAVLGATA